MALMPNVLVLAAGEDFEISVLKFTKIKLIRITKSETKESA